MATDCSDGNACTIDTCNATLGCQHTAAPEPVPVDMCHTTFCDTVIGVVSQPRICRPEDTCVCKPAEGCVCATAANPKTNKNATVGIMAAIIAAIALLVIAFIVAAVFAAKKAKQMRASLAPSANAQQLVSDNPLYEAKEGQMDNPMYVGLE